MTTASAGGGGPVVPPLQPAGAHWTPLRRQILQFLDDKAPSLAELYFGAVTMLFDLHLPGRVRFASHAAREITNRLPEVLTGIKVRRVDYATEMDELSEAWMNAGLLPDAGPDGAAASDAPVSIPRPVFARTAELLNRHRNARETPKEAALRLFKAIAVENRALGGELQPMIRQWVKVQRFFVGQAHNALQPDAAHEAKLIVKFELFEVALGALVGGFYSRLDDIDDILAQANS